MIREFIEKIIKALPGPKKAPFFRDKTTHRPYMLTDKLRDVLIVNVDRIKYNPSEFAKRVVDKNKKLLSEYILALSLDQIKEKDKNMITRAIEIDFALGIDTNLSWFYEII